MHPELTLVKLKDELCRNTRYKTGSTPLPHFTRDDKTKLALVRKVKTIAPAPVAINVDGVDMKFDAIVILEGHIPQRFYLGQQDLRCYKIGEQDAQVEARIDKRASLVAFYIPPGAYSPLRDDRHRLSSFNVVLDGLPEDCLLSCSELSAI